MEDRIWSMIVSVLETIQPGYQRFRYQVAEILQVALWAILHDRPMNWACQSGHWPERCRPRGLPHPSTLSRRWRSSELQAAAKDVERAVLAKLGPVARLAAVDGQPLLVGGSSKDEEAHAGRAVGGMGRGYKLHAVADDRHVILEYEVEPLNIAEQTVAARLLRRLPKSVDRIVGDTHYDSLNLHSVAEESGRRLYTPIREGRVGRRQQPRRVHLLRLSQRAVGERLLNWRDGIERTFGQYSSISFGYKGLPSWARRLHRVRRWMWGKILLHHTWLLLKRQVA